MDNELLIFVFFKYSREPTLTICIAFLAKRTFPLNLNLTARHWQDKSILNIQCHNLEIFWSMPANSSWSCHKKKSFAMNWSIFQYQAQTSYFIIMSIDITYILCTSQNSTLIFYCMNLKVMHPMKHFWQENTQQF